jgi:hypothetical protein
MAARVVPWAMLAAAAAASALGFVLVAMWAFYLSAALVVGATLVAAAVGHAADEFEPWELVRVPMSREDEWAVKHGPLAWVEGFEPDGMVRVVPIGDGAIGYYWPDELERT